jgi:hypothetical protein
MPEPKEPGEQQQVHVLLVYCSLCTDADATEPATPFSPRISSHAPDSAVKNALKPFTCTPIIALHHDCCHAEGAIPRARMLAAAAVSAGTAVSCPASAQAGSRSQTAGLSVTCSWRQAGECTPYSIGWYVCVACTLQARGVQKRCMNCSRPART